MTLQEFCTKNGYILKDKIDYDEVWKDIPGYEGIYQASTHGRIRSFKDNKGSDRVKVLKLYKMPSGYLKVELCNNGIGKNFKIHRLIALTFIPNPNNLKEVNHIDGNKDNNYANNLERSTRKDNMYHYYNKLFINKKIIQYDKQLNLIREFNSATCIKIELNIGVSNIHKVCKGERKTAGGFIFKYK